MREAIKLKLIYDNQYDILFRLAYSCVLDAEKADLLIHKVFYRASLKNAIETNDVNLWLTKEIKKEIARELSASTNGHKGKKKHKTA